MREALEGIPMLVFANKQDLPSSMGVSELTDKLGLNCIHPNRWFVQASCATTGDGIYEGLDWLLDVASGREANKEDAAKNKPAAAVAGQKHDAATTPAATLVGPAMKDSKDLDDSGSAADTES